jgi:hypothetical protein
MKMPGEKPMNLCDADYSDSLLEEIWKIREEMAAEWHNDLSLMVPWFEEQQRLDPIEGLIDHLPRTAKRA